MAGKKDWQLNYINKLKFEKWISGTCFSGF